jgi:hypothetical protein
MNLPNADFNHQMRAIQDQINGLKTQGASFVPQMQIPQYAAPVHKISPVDGLSGAEAILREMPAGSSDIVAHRTEDIIYILARDENNVPAPIQVAKIEFIQAQEDPTGYVTKKDFDNFKEELKALIAQKGEGK